MCIQSWLGGQKKWSWKVPRGSSPRVATGQDPRPDLRSSYILLKTPKRRILWSKMRHSSQLIDSSSKSTSSHPVFYIWLYSLNDALTKMSATWHWTDIARSHFGSPGTCFGLVVQSGREVRLAPRGHPCGAGACEIEGELTKSAHSLCILAGSQDGAEGDNHFKLWIPF